MVEIIHVGCVCVEGVWVGEGGCFDPKGGIIFQSIPFASEYHIVQTEVLGRKGGGNSEKRREKKNLKH